MDELYRDVWIAAFSKPAGIPVHRDWANDPVDAVRLAKRLTQRWTAPVHRLDRGTSGVLLFAFSSETAGLLQDHFREHTVQKSYRALVCGLCPEAGEIDAMVPKKLSGPRVEARTTYRRLGTIDDRYSWVECSPQTGRLHQIRRHFRHIGHPLVHDTRYGDANVTATVRERYGLLRLALHAGSLTMVHPHTGAPLHIEAPLPGDLRVPLSRMGLASLD